MTCGMCCVTEQSNPRSNRLTFVSAKMRTAIGYPGYHQIVTIVPTYQGDFLCV